MKTFREFMLEASPSVPPNSPASGGGISVADIDARSDLTPEQKSKLKARRTNWPGETIRGNQQPTGNPSQPQQPPSGTQPNQQPPSRTQPTGNPSQPQQPPSGTQAGNTPPSSSTTTPSSGRTPNTYRSTGTGRVETPTNPVNAGRRPGVQQTLRNNIRNAPNAIRNTNLTKGLKSGALIGAGLVGYEEKQKGSGWLRTLARGATVAAGTALGGVGGAALGTAVAPGLGTAVGGYAGQAAGGAAADAAFNTVAGANAVERKAIATTNRQRQSGGEIKGIGGSTSFSQKKPGGAAFMSTGSGPQRKTVELAKTSVVTDPKSGKQEVGNLAFQGGKAVYKRADTKSLAQTSSNPLERIGRTIAAGAYKDNDAKLAAAKLATARASDATRNQKLGVKLKPGG